MLSSIARAAIKRVVSTTTTTTSLHRIAVSRIAVNAPKSNYAFVRSFATPGRPKASAKASTKASTKTSTATKKRTATKKPARKQAKSTKSKTTKSKAAVKPKPATRRRKPLTPERQAILEKRELKKTALFTEPKHLAISPWTVFVQEQTKQKSQDPAGLRSGMTQLSQAFKALPASEFQRLTTAAEENKLAYAAAYKAWVETHTPIEINKAIRARVTLKRKYNFPVRSVKTIHDDRIPKRPLNSFSLFTKARWASGAYAHSTIPESGKAISQEWKNLPQTERQAYGDLAKSNTEHYDKEVQSVLHRTVHRRPST
ncbi:hypothetical protein F4820DRAFT_449712 [Hypoxylon rubiginosum]|uniref:Uncharacterized protein n=1 Tax=Hypoxylon rubiginosum TaxID=110542 RepID=A0ACB9YWX8_9PEZI|nr:hypothetical protein F4820DRAFT_449712 [Hypoxylon rubiginosum]